MLFYFIDSLSLSFLNIEMRLSFDGPETRSFFLALQITL